MRRSLFVPGLLGACVLAALAALVVLWSLPPPVARLPAVPTLAPPGGLEWIELSRRDEGDPNDNAALGHLEISRTEVTKKQYALCVAAGACSRPDAASRRCNWLEPGREDHPINCVDWYQARTFAAWIGGRLPTEAEWTFAARDGGPARLYPWGGEKATCEHAQGPTCEGATAAVCQTPLGETDHGLCDLGGNVWEWIEDAGADDAPFHVLKGGGFDALAEVKDRRVASPGIRFPWFGFRVVRSSMEAD